MSAAWLLQAKGKYDVCALGALALKGCEVNSIRQMLCEREK